MVQFVPQLRNFFRLLGNDRFLCAARTIGETAKFAVRLTRRFRPPSRRFVQQTIQGHQRIVVVQVVVGIVIVGRIAPQQRQQVRVGQIGRSSRSRSRMGRRIRWRSVATCADGSRGRGKGIPRRQCGIVVVVVMVAVVGNEGGFGGGQRRSRRGHEIVGKRQWKVSSRGVVVRVIEGAVRPRGGFPQTAGAVRGRLTFRFVVVIVAAAAAAATRRPRRIAAQRPARVKGLRRLGPCPENGFGQARQQRGRRCRWRSNGGTTGLLVVLAACDPKTRRGGRRRRAGARALAQHHALGGPPPESSSSSVQVAAISSAAAVRQRRVRAPVRRRLRGRIRFARAAVAAAASRPFLVLQMLQIRRGGRLPRCSQDRKARHGGSKQASTYVSQQASNVSKQVNKQVSRCKCRNAATQGKGMGGGQSAFLG